MFPDLHGGYFNPRYLEKTFSKIIAEAALPPGTTMHDLRHSAASILLSMGINIKVIQELLGHSNVSLTLDTYSHLLPSMQNEAMNMWDILFRPPDP